MQKTILYAGSYKEISEEIRPCDRQTDERTDTQQRFVKSGGCTDNAEKTTQDIIRKNHEIGESPPTDPKA